MSTALVIMGIAGRMGSTIARLANASDDLRIAGVVDQEEKLSSSDYLDIPHASSAEKILPLCPGAVIVDFTVPAATMITLDAAIRHGNPMVIGTTGLTPEQYARVDEAAKTIPVMLSPNMSLGVNAMLDILPRLARQLGPDYDIDIAEIHHRHKKDAPSGTALRLGKCIADAKGWKLEEVGRYCREGITGERPAQEIGLQTLRGGDVAGVHTVYFMGDGERIEVTHHAHSRDTFAAGALRAARWLSGRKPGMLYSMQHVLGE